MKRTKAFRREQRKRHINHKIYIIRYHWGREPWKPEGYYSKNKVHCSCPTCSGYRKTNSKFVTTFGSGKNWSKRDMKQILREFDTY